MNGFKFSLEPGIKKYENMEYNTHEPIISVIIPFYNSGEYIEQTIISVLNQTFPYYEILIIDDGSKDEKSLKKLEKIEKLDKRIKVFHKKNEGLAATRDFGARQASESSKYLMFLDDDDLIEPTFFECAYWTMDTNKEAAWAYSDSVGFGTMEYTWNKFFNSEKLKKVNELISEAFVRKTAFNEVNGYELREKAVNEDWNFWLKLLAKGKYPVHMSFYGQWYRRKEVGDFKKASEKAGPVLLEPIMKIEVVTPEESMGDVISDLNKRRGQIEGMESSRSGARIVKATAPLAEMFGYVTALRTITSGRATSTMSFSHYSEVSSSIAKNVLTEVNGRVDLL